MAETAKCFFCKHEEPRKKKKKQTKDNCLVSVWPIKSKIMTGVVLLWPIFNDLNVHCVNLLLKTRSQRDCQVILEKNTMGEDAVYSYKCGLFLVC